MFLILQFNFETAAMDIKTVVWKPQQFFFETHTIEFFLSCLYTNQPVCTVGKINTCMLMILSNFGIVHNIVLFNSLDSSQSFVSFVMWLSMSHRLYCESRQNNSSLFSLWTDSKTCHKYLTQNPIFWKNLNL